MFSKHVKACSQNIILASSLTIQSDVLGTSLFDITGHATTGYKTYKTKEHPARNKFRSSQ